MTAFGPEWTIIPLESGAWRQQVKDEVLDLVFIESAWRPNRGRWRSAVNGPLGPQAEVRQVIVACRDTGIPTVFWNKEDPVHFRDFLDCARLTDVVFTTDANRVSDYRSELGHDRIGVLPFAAQPAVHHPARPYRGSHARGIAFAGMYFSHKFPGRAKQLDRLLDGAVDVAASGEGRLEIFARHSGTDDRYQYPARFARFVVGSLTYDRMLTAYRAYRVFLNVNTVNDSPTMCARRLFEIPASGTPVVTARSPAVDHLFGGTGIVQVESREEAAAALRDALTRPDEEDRRLHLVQRRIWDEHSYAHRAEEVLRLALPAFHRPVSRPTVSALVSTFRPDRLPDLFRMLSEQRDVRLQVILLTHGFGLNGRTIRELRDSPVIEDLVLLEAPRAETLGACLNRCVEAADGQIFAKIDDDDVYAPHYLHDVVNAVGYSGADIVGKQARYVQVAEQTLLRYPDAEHRWTDRVAGPTIAGPAESFRQTTFSEVTGGEDTQFLDRIIRVGGRVYSADRFNFCQYRNRADHTWAVSDRAMMASSRIMAHGDPRHIITL